ncbi:MAG TPA: DUF3099 domain-containing protein [Pseudonocardiaceae bacterium]|nr:DUF3099 domain-containing protein [Pseudonocardiaceae bacterium]
MGTVRAVLDVVVGSSSAVGGSWKAYVSVRSLLITDAALSFDEQQAHRRRTYSILMVVHIVGFALSYPLFLWQPWAGVVAVALTGVLPWAAVLLANDRWMEPLATVPGQDRRPRTCYDGRLECKRSSPRSRRASAAAHQAAVERLALSPQRGVATAILGNAVSPPCQPRTHTQTGMSSLAPRLGSLDGSPPDSVSLAPAESCRSPIRRSASETVVTDDGLPPPDVPVLRDRERASTRTWSLPEPHDDAVADRLVSDSW